MGAQSRRGVRGPYPAIPPGRRGSSRPAPAPSPRPAETAASDPCPRVSLAHTRPLPMGIPCPRVPPPHMRPLPSQAPPIPTSTPHLGAGEGGAAGGAGSLPVDAAARLALLLPLAASLAEEGGTQGSVRPAGVQRGTPNTRVITPGTAHLVELPPVPALAEGGRDAVPGAVAVVAGLAGATGGPAAVAWRLAEDVLAASLAAVRRIGALPALAHRTGCMWHRAWHRHWHRHRHGTGYRDRWLSLGLAPSSVPSLATSRGRGTAGATHGSRGGCRGSGAWGAPGTLLPRRGAAGAGAGGRAAHPFRTSPSRGTRVTTGTTGSPLRGGTQDTAAAARGPWYGAGMGTGVSHRYSPPGSS